MSQYGGGLISFSLSVSAALLFSKYQLLSTSQQESILGTIIQCISFLLPELVCNNKAGLVRGDGDNREFHPEVIESLVLIAEVSLKDNNHVTL